MTDYFCPVCDNELSGPAPLCPHCHSLTGFEPASTVLEKSAAAGASEAVLLPPPPLVGTAPVDVDPPTAAADDSELPQEAMSPPDVPPEESPEGAAAFAAPAPV